MKNYQLINEVYGCEAYDKFISFLSKYKTSKTEYQLSNNDTFLITYGDTIKSEKSGFER